MKRDIVVFENDDRAERPTLTAEARPINGFRRPGYHSVDYQSWIELREFLRLARKHLRVIMVVAAAFMALALVRDLNKTPMYTASATLLVRTSAPPLFVDENINPQQTQFYEDPQVFAQTQSQLLRSRSLAASVIREEGLLGRQTATANHKNGPSLLTALRGRLAAWLPNLFSAGSPAKKLNPLADAAVASNSGSDQANVLAAVGGDDSGTRDVPRSLIDWYLGALKIAPIESTQLIKVQFTTDSPQLSARLANAHARAYIRRGLELNSQASTDAERFLSGKLEELKKRVEQSEIALNNYRRDKGIIPGLISINGKHDVVLQQLNKLSGDLQTAHLKAITLGTEVELIKSGRADSLPGVLDNKLIQGLKAELDQEQAKYDSMSGEYTPDYPEMKDLSAKIDGTRAVLNRELAAAATGVNEQYQSALKRERMLSDDLDKEKSLVLGLNDAAIKYTMLARDAETNRELYDAVLKRIKNLTVVAGAQGSNVSVVDSAQPPYGPSSPRTVRDLIAAGALGLLFGLGGALFLERLDNTFKTPEDTERYLGVPYLGMVPDFSSVASIGYGYDKPAYGNGYDKRPSEGGMEDGNLKETSTTRGELVANYGTYSVLAESYRQIRTALLLSRASSHPKVTMFTSALAHEGKTTVTINTAVVLAHTGSRVVVIDADMRRPRCHKVLGMSNRAGLTEALTGGGGPELARPTPIENLFLMSSGRKPPNPSELLGSVRWRELLDELSAQFDYVVVDSSPVMMVSDPLIASRSVDGVVFVVAGGRTPRPQVAAALGRLEQINAKIFGVVLNAVKLHKSDYPQYYSNSYRSYYLGGTPDGGFEDFAENSLSDTQGSWQNGDRQS